MKVRLTTIGLLFALMSAFVLVPSGSALAKPAAKSNGFKAAKARAKFSDATLNVTRFSVNAAGKLAASGTVTSAKGQLATFNDAEVVLQQEGCTLLNIRLEPIDLEIAGLRIQTSFITLRITAVPGEGNLLGNLLCNAPAAAQAQALNQALARRGGSLSNQTALAGSVSVDIVGFSEQGGQIFANYLVRGLRGRAVGTFQAPVTLQQQPRTCTILTLVLGPLDLNLLGLRIQLYGETEEDPVTITITGERGRGNLLGNLLCGLARLLDDRQTPARQRAIAAQLNRILAAAQ